MSYAKSPPPKNTRDLYDPLAVRQNVQDYAKKAFEAKFKNFESKKYKLSLKDCHLPQADKHISLADQKNAILERRDVTVPIKGTVEMHSKEDGSLIDRKEVVLARLPYITERQTSIYNGSEYLAGLQARLLPGVYTRIKESGEAEGHINTKSGSGLGGRVIFYPDRELFIYKVDNTQIPLYGLLKGLGASDDHMREAWGDQLFLKNKSTFTGDEMSKLHDKLFTYRK